MDLMSNIKVVQAMKPHSPAATGTITGDVIDTAGFNSHTFVMQAGLQTEDTLTVIPVVNSGSTSGSLSAVDDADLIGTEAEANLSGDAGAEQATKIGYIGKNRYIRLDVGVVNAATGVYSAVCIQGDPIKAPQGQS
jgi:hypothetical protein